MALGKTNITTADVKNEIGSTSNAVAELVGDDNLNPCSFYAPGILDVDINCDVTLTPPTTNFKLGDFRLYNHSAIPPSISPLFTGVSWGPPMSDFNFIVPIFPQWMNIKEFADVKASEFTPNWTVKFYPTDTDRTDERNVIKTVTQEIDFNTVPAEYQVANHTRTSTLMADTGPVLISITGFPTAVLDTGAGGTVIYIEVFISDASGNRRINFGVRENGYSNVQFTYNKMPYVLGYNSAYPASHTGYTAVFARVYSTPGAACIESTVNQDVGTSYSFNLVAYAVGGVDGPCLIKLPVCSAKLTVDGIDTILKVAGNPVFELPKTGLTFTGTLTGGTFNYNDYCRVTFTSGTTIDGTDTTNCT